MLSDERMKDIAHQVGKNPTQQAAIVKALSLVADELVTSEVQDTVLTTVEPAQVAVCVTSGNNVTDDQARTLWPALDKALARFGAIEVITFGGQGAEHEARRWAERNKQRHRDYALAWVVPQPDGTTIRNSKALGTRNRNLLEYLEQVPTVIALRFGFGEDRSMKNANANFRLLVTKAEAFHVGRKLPVVDEPVVEAPVSEEAELAEHVLEGDEVAGQPDTPVEVVA